MIYSGILAPVFDDIQYCTPTCNKSQDELKWINTTCKEALIALCDLLNAKYDILHFLIGDFVSLLCLSISNTHEIMCKVALDTLTHLALETGSRYTEEMWETLMKSFTDLFYTTVPDYLVSEEVELEDLE